MAKRNSSGQDFTNNPDGWDLSGGTASRKLTIFGGDVSISGAGSFVYSFPGYNSNLMGATGISVNSIPKFTSLNGLGNSIIYDDGIGVSIGASGGFTTFPNHETLRISATGSTTSNSFNLVTGFGNVNNYLQVNIQNKNSGSSASTDLVITNDIGSETFNYVDLGINSSNFIGNSTDMVGSGSDGYLYSYAKDFWIGNTSGTYSMRFFAGGGTNSSSQEFEVMKVTPSKVNVLKDLELDRYIIDVNGATGSTGKVLTATANGVYWSVPSGGVVTKQIGLVTNLPYPGLTGTIEQTHFGIGYSATITNWYLTCFPTASVSIDVWKSNSSTPTVVNSIVGTSSIVITSGRTASGSVSGQFVTNAISVGDYFMMAIRSNDLATYINLQLVVTS